MAFIVIDGKLKYTNKAVELPEYRKWFSKSKDVFVEDVAAEEVPQIRMTQSEAEKEWNVKIKGGKKQRTVELSEYKGKAAQLIIPSYIDDMPVVSVQKVCNANTHFRSVVIPATVKTVGKKAFEGCSTLSHVTLATDAVVAIGAFKKCPCLVDRNGCNTVGGVLHEYPQKDDVVLTEGIEIIPSSAFKWLKALTSVIIPEGVTKIGSNAFAEYFQDESTLTYVRLPSTLEEIGLYAFGDCRNLQINEIPQKCRIIGEGAFHMCRRLCVSLVIPEGIEIIAESAFYGCSSLKTVRLPGTLKAIEFLAFSYCSSLESIQLPEGFEKLGCRAFDECTHLRSINFPSSITEIASGAFANCVSLQTEIPEFVQKLSPDAFAGCSKLIGRGDFLIINNTLVVARNDLSRAVIPDGVREICSSVFYENLSLKEVVLPSSLFLVGEHCFAGCSSLQQVIHPCFETVQVRKDAFAGCTKLLNAPTNDAIIIGRNLIKYCGGKKEYRIPDGIVRVATNALSDRNGMDKLIVPASVRHLDDEAIRNVKQVVFEGEFPFNEDVQGYFPHKDSFDNGMCILGDCLVKADLSGAFGVIEVPTSVKRICCEAFESDWGTSSLITVKLPEGLEALTLCDVSSEKLIFYIPDSVKTIRRRPPKDRAFGNHGGKTILRAHKGSCAEQFCLTHSNEYREYVFQAVKEEQA